ncbi:hypothetical protein DL96DRAFT_151104 [Flagelloscypha sp. PMI_526]|nr:hypothetical protein DL96DRAFT_151104 [Flagelloscypha sp. PMI_526]
MAFLSPSADLLKVHLDASVPSGLDELNYRALLIGHFLTMIGFGFTFFQTYLYFTRCPKEGLVNKVFAGLISALDLAITALVSRYAYDQIITNFWSQEDVVRMILASNVEYTLSAMAVLVVQLFYSYQVWRQTNKLYIAVPMAILTVAAFAFMMTSSARLYQNLTFSSLSAAPAKQMKAAGLGITCIVAFMHGSFLGLPAYQREIMSTNKGLGAIYDRIVLCVVDPGVLAAFVQLGYFATFLRTPSQPLWLPLHFVVTKLFINACLSFLTSTDVDDSLVTSSTLRYTSRNEREQVSRFSGMHSQRPGLHNQNQFTGSGKGGINRLSLSGRGDFEDTIKPSHTVCGS